ncbi:MAG TPA: rRNA maturation RNase YbeY [Candidatus Acidoferrales bacterium]|nr:rRNA maturation RNase YbeY [Candidatus Acidoferrales bacterium]
MTRPSADPSGVLNQQRQVPIAVAPMERFLARVHRRLRLRRGAVCVSLVSPARIARWNRSYRGKNKPTDVLSFPIEDRDASGRAARRPSPAKREYLGDIAIAPAVAKRNARRFGRAFDDEMRILVLHGVLHLMGYDHETDRGQMDRIERKLRREMGLE